MREVINPLGRVHPKMLLILFHFISFFSFFFFVALQTLMKHARSPISLSIFLHLQLAKSSPLVETKKMLHLAISPLFAGVKIFSTQTFSNALLCTAPQKLACIFV